MPENRLAQESSPYLRQHKDNPVDWRPWSAETLAEAKAADKPILLSIGYAACHWCHVMAHESFEDAATAELMNELFVNIKVDREERPDLDSIYQQALALLGEHGGWPLTMFLTPEGAPFWGGTYFPPQPNFGRPGFPQVLQSVALAYRNRPADVDKNVTALKQALTKLAQPEPAGLLPTDILIQVASQLAGQVDPQDGGLGGAPKFPQTSALKLLWLAWLRSGQAPLRQAVVLTLERMSQGGIYDHLGGGYARYATDRHWLVPHFEKMLYDNALLIELLTTVARATGSALLEQRLRETVDWLLREMIAETAPGGPACGAFASSYDADSEGEEGKFYVWSEAEIDALLGVNTWRFKQAYDVTPEGNWEGKVILNRSQAPELGDGDHEAALAEARQTLFTARRDRSPPGWDDKVLADWNGLAITALARAAVAFQEPAWLAAAERAFAFVCAEMSDGDRLLHAWRHGRAKHAGTLDDYANLCEAALALYQTTGKADYLARAEAWTAILERHFWDGLGGGYFMTADDSEALIVRPKNAADSATPAGNGTMVSVLAALYYLTGTDAYRERATALIAAFSGEVARNIFAATTLLTGRELLFSAEQLVIVGARGEAASEALLAAAFAVALPSCLVQVVAEGAELPQHHPAASKTRVDGQAAAYLCRGQSCSLPITDPATLTEALLACRSSA
jgi:uncharacterized protein YyaL (SSP411 family)